MSKRGSGKALKRWIPRVFVSRLAAIIYRSRASRLLIVPFIRRYGVKMEDYVRPAEKYRSLVDFFCREIKPESRPIASGQAVFASPVDGRIAEYGRIASGRMIQAKGIDYTSEGLLGDADAARRYEGGLYITTYLSPADYHRIHAPTSGALVASKRIRGSRWPVNETGVQDVARLFEKNERLVTYLDTPLFGRLAIVKVGAFIVGRIVVTYEERVDSRADRRGKTIDLSRDGITVTKGEELGRFEFGSTVILLMEPGPYAWSAGVERNAKVRMGQPILERRN